MLSASADSIASYMPQIHGTIRPRWEMDLDHDVSHFQVRNARLSVSGNIIPQISYFIQSDFCNQGKFLFLDAYGQIQLARGLNLRAGQFRMPMGSDPTRLPHTYYFANRSALRKYIDSYRAVGARFAFTLPSVPLLIEAGAFNPSKIGDHTVWSDALAYSSKIRYTLRGFSLTGGFQSMRPKAVRMNFFDIGLRYDSGRWFAEAEYINEHYTHHTHAPCQGWNIFGNYAMPVKAGIFNRLSFQARFDGMTAYSDGYSDSESASSPLPTTQAAFRRITLGSTLSYRASKVWCDMRLNYEKKFHNAPSTSPGDGDRLTAEIVIRF